MQRIEMTETMSLTVAFPPYYLDLNVYHLRHTRSLCLRPSLRAACHGFGCGRARTASLPCLVIHTGWNRNAVKGVSWVRTGRYPSGLATDPCRTGWLDGEVMTPKSGHGGTIDISTKLSEVFSRWGIERKTEKLRCRWAELPRWLFYSDAETVRREQCP